MLLLYELKAISAAVLPGSTHKKAESPSWARSEAGLSRLPVTEEIAGSNPVGPAKTLSINTTP
jgi:hypothetical protein